MALCVAQDDPASTGIWQKIRRSLDPNQAKNPRDRARREAARQKVLKQVKPASEVNERTMLPSFKSNLESGGTHAISIDPEALRLVVEKWVRGIFYHRHRTYVEEGDAINIYQVPEDAAFEALKGFDNPASATFHDGGPGVFVSEWNASDEKQNLVLYEFIIWEKLKVYATIGRQLT